MPIPSDEKGILVLRFLDVTEKKFNIDTLEERIKLQKLLYLAQTYGLNFDYHYSWYFHGPYSSSLADVLYKIDESELMSSAQKLPLTEISDDANKIQRFKELVSPYLNDVTWLEAAASILWIRKRHYRNVPLENCRDSLVKDVSFVYKRFDPAIVLDVLERLEQYGLLS